MLETDDIGVYKINGEKIIDYEDLKKEINEKQLNFFKIHKEDIESKLIILNNLYGPLINYIKSNPNFILDESSNFNLLINSIESNPDKFILSVSSVLYNINIEFNTDDTHNMQLIIKLYENNRLRQLLNKLSLLVNTPDNVKEIITQILELYNIFKARLTVYPCIISTNDEDKILEEDNNNLTKEDLTKNRCIKYVDINEEFFKTISKKYLLVYENNIHDKIKNLLDDLVDKILKLFNVEPLNDDDIQNILISDIPILVKSNIDTLVKLLDIYDIEYIDNIFNLDFYFKQKKEEIIQNIPDFNITRLYFIQGIIKDELKKLLKMN